MIGATPRLDQGMPRRGFAQDSARICTNIHAYAWDSSIELLPNFVPCSASFLSSFFLRGFDEPNARGSLGIDRVNGRQQSTLTSAAKGVFEVTPSESTILAKSLVDIAAILKEIKERQAAASKPLTQHAKTSQQVPVKHCGICSCNSHFTDECPQLQEDQTIAASHNFYDNQQSSPNNR
ncbi:hypothetical protein PIB30_090469 [Stylosanthes scabra]|uniref:Uncharacterized protein n=1 Tax=Stylosanthes scabra TaxID=79078 RepID=A0ABU6QWP7_9FABA|nr:hypothetical protein [Stylosanthes scabra]